MEAAEESSNLSARPKEVQIGRSDGQLEARPSESPQASTTDINGACTSNHLSAESIEKDTAIVDAGSKRSRSVNSSGLSTSSPLPPSNSLKHTLLRSRFGQWLAFAVTGNKSDFLSYGQHDDKPRPWISTFFRFGPLSGLFCLFLAIASIIASLGILAGSDQQAVQRWSVPPSTYLAVFTALGNLSVRYAAFQGIVIAWWYRASKGSKLSQLHHDWRTGMSLRGAFGALLYGRKLGLLGLACLFSTIVVIDGPLLQRSSTVKSVEKESPTHLNVTLAPEIPSHFTGAWYEGARSGTTNGGTFNASFPTPNGPSWKIPITQARRVTSWRAQNMLANQDAIEGAVRGCSSRLCKAKVKAPALFRTDCVSEIIESHVKAPYNVDAVINRTMAAPLENVYFIIDVDFMPAEHETINLITAYWTRQSGSDNCHGSLNLTTCTLKSGIGEYDFILDGDKATVDPNSALRPELVALANNTRAHHSEEENAKNPSTLAGISYILGVTYGTYGYYAVYGDQFIPFSRGWAYPYQWANISEIENEVCPSYLDPTDDVLQAANMLMVYLGVIAGNRSSTEDFLARMDPGLEINYTVPGTVYDKHNVFQTNYWFFLGAAIVEIVCIAFIAPTYWGWWRFGRPTSLSPLEIAKAFNSPLLADYDSNASGNDLAKAVGDLRLRYGATSTNTIRESSKLEFADPALVDEPRQGAHFDPPS